MAKRKRGKSAPDSPLQGRLQSQIAKARWTGSLKDMAVSRPSQYPEYSDERLNTMSPQMLQDLESWATQRNLSDLYVRIQVARRNQATSAPSNYVNITNNPQPYGQTITWTQGGLQTFIGPTSPTPPKPPKPPKPTQKVGDWVKLKKDYIFYSGKVNMGAVGRVSKVGTRYVYVQLEGSLSTKAGIKFESSDLETVEAPTPKELDLSRVIMPDDHREAIKEAVAQLEHNDKIFQDWGFDDILEKGKAISMLFFGPPGTGKTMCAEIIAKTLGKKLEIIGTGEIQSSEPGQAERNIKAYFEKSDKDTMLLFDECDSLVHSRNSTGSIMAAQINALLTALERYEGIVIFTTNRLGVLDEAFNRRLSLKLHFPMPSKEQRLQIWKGMFPKKAPLDKNIKWEKLAALELTGGYIKNIVLRAARSAATQGLDTITYEVLKNAAIHEEMSKREFEEAARHHRRGGVTTIDEAIQDFGQDNRLEVRDGTTGTSARAGKDQKK